MNIKINDKDYITNIPTFGLLRKLEERGININAIGENNMFSFISNYFSIMCNLSLDDVDIEISQHIEKYGMDSLAGLVNQAISSLDAQGFSEGAKKTPKKVTGK